MMMEVCVMAMKFRAHDTFFIRKGWLSKGMERVVEKPDLFIDKKENPMDILGIGSNMVKALRYWLQAVGLTTESTRGRRIQSLTPLGEQVYLNDRYIEELGTLYLLQYQLAKQKEEATAWYFFFNEFSMSEFTREEFVQALQNYILMADDASSVAIRSLNDDFACIINTYLPRYKSNPGKVFPENNIDCPFGELGLQSYDTAAYERFEKIYPTLTAGSIFNPFLGFDVVDLYEEAVRGLKRKGYTGIYVIYDEFSKFLEANITEASVSDTKMLQDFAEKCNRSGEQQMHLMLISHKEIANYIDKLPKQKVDGWRGVSERFKHIHLNNNFTQTYEIIESAIQKKEKLWETFRTSYRDSFEGLIQRYEKHNIFSDVAEGQVEKTIYGCYPLHPVSTFILPRLSERVAQNERTLFTFISAPGVSTLPTFLESYQDDYFEVITPDLIYDYFEPLLKKEIYSGTIHENYILTELILEKLQTNSLESKIVKTLSLIYILEQFEKLQPSKDELISIFSISYSSEEINQAIDNLIEKEYVIYLKRSNNYLRLKQTSGVDIRQKICDMVEVQNRRVTVKETLNNSNFDNYVYPSRYNNERDMIRFFSFEFIDEDEVTEDIDWTRKSEAIEADGVIYGIIPHSEESIDRLKDMLITTSKNCDRYIFILPKHFSPIEEIIREFTAVSVLRDSANDDKVLFEEYEVIYEDLREVIGSFMRGYTRPDKNNVDRMSLSSVIKDWCESLDQTVFEQLFTDGTDKCLGLFKTITNDDDFTIARLAKLATDLRIEDWDEKVKILFTSNVKKYKETAEGYHSTKESVGKEQSTSAYQISFTDDNGDVITKRFDKVEGTGKGRLLYNQVTAALDSMGRSISDQEKRQILMEILKKLC